MSDLSQPEVRKEHYYIRDNKYDYHIVFKGDTRLICLVGKDTTTYIYISIGDNGTRVDMKVRGRPVIADKCVALHSNLGYLCDESKVFEPKYLEIVRKCLLS